MTTSPRNITTNASLCQATGDFIASHQVELFIVVRSCLSTLYPAKTILQKEAHHWWGTALIQVTEQGTERPQFSEHPFNEELQRIWNKWTMPPSRASDLILCIKQQKTRINYCSQNKKNVFETITWRQTSHLSGCREFVSAHSYQQKLGRKWRSQVKSTRNFL